MNNLSRNIRFLRKQLDLSQQQLADTLSIKRSNIAAYETKNVEPRLSLINRMSEFFRVSLTDLIMNDIEALRRRGGPESELFLGADRALELMQQSDKINKMLEGFKVFYEYKKEVGETTSTNDIDNFLVFISHMLDYNERIASAIQPDDRDQQHLNSTTATDEARREDAFHQSVGSPSR